MLFCFGWGLICFDLLCFDLLCFVCFSFSLFFVIPFLLNLNHNILSISPLTERLKTEGLFRVSSNYRELEELKKQYSNPSVQVDLEQTKVPSQKNHQIPCLSRNNPYLFPTLRLPPSPCHLSHRMYIMFVGSSKHGFHNSQTLSSPLMSTNR